MTVTGKTARTFSIDVSAESLSKTAGMDARGEVNLEKSLRLGDRIDGHLVSGHVDGTGVVHAFEARGESVLFVVEAPPALARYLAYKGSIAVNGVSLTVNRVEDPEPGGCRVWINLIPHTIAVTALKHLKPGDRVNLEVDMIARYVERMLGAVEAQPRPG
jgi:riboflavin synthase